MNPLQTQIEALLEDHQTRHSQLQIDSFIIGKSGAGHPYGEYRQCLRELNSRYLQRFELVDTIEEKKLDLQDSAEKERKESLRKDQKREQIRRRRLERSIMALEKNLVELDREIERFFELTVACKERVGELTEDRRNTLDREFWVHRLRFKAAIDILRTGSPSTTVLEIACTLDTELRERIMGMLSPGRAQELVAWFNQGAPMLYHEKQLDELPSTAIKMVDGHAHKVPSPF